MCVKRAMVSEFGCLCVCVQRERDGERKTTEEGSESKIVGVSELEGQTRWER